MYVYVIAGNIVTNQNKMRVISVKMPEKWPGLAIFTIMESVSIKMSFKNTTNNYNELS